MSSSADTCRSKKHGLFATLILNRLYFNSFVGAPSEFLAALALRHADQILARNRALARANLAHLREFLGRHAALFAWQPPRGGVVAFPRWLGQASTTALSDRLLRERGLLLAPSAHFAGGERHVRLGFGTAATPANLALLEAALGPAGRH